MRERGGPSERPSTFRPGRACHFPFGCAMIASPMLKAQPPPSAIARARRGGDRFGATASPRSCRACDTAVGHRGTSLRPGLSARRRGRRVRLPRSRANAIRRMELRVYRRARLAGCLPCIRALPLARAPAGSNAHVLAFEVVGAFGIALKSTDTVSRTTHPEVSGSPGPARGFSSFRLSVPEPPGRSAVA